MILKRIIGLTCFGAAMTGVLLIVLGVIYVKEHPDWLGIGVITFACTFGIGLRLGIMEKRNK